MTSMTAVLPGVAPTSHRLTEMNMCGTVTLAAEVRMGMVSRTAVPAVMTSSMMAMRSPSLGL